MRDGHLQNLLWGQAQLNKALGFPAYGEPANNFRSEPVQDITDEARSSCLPAEEPREATQDE